MADQLPFTVLQPFGTAATPGGLDGKPLYNFTSRKVRVTGTTYTLKATDSGSFITFSNDSGIVLNIPASLPEGFNCLLLQKGAGAVSFAFGTGATNLSATAALATLYQYATIVVDENVDGGHAEFLVISNVSVDSPTNGVPPIITGVPTEGRTLQASTGVWSPTPTAYTYQWKRSGLSIAGATNASYVLTTEDIGNEITCTVSAANANGSAAATTAPTDIVQASAPTNSAPIITILPVISGTATQGASLTVSNGAWLYSPTTYAYQWKRAGVDISGATSAVKVLVAADVGTQITCTVTATNANGSTNATTAPTGVVTAGAPVNSTVPIITGTAQVSQTLSASNGTWINNPSSYAYQWTRGGANIAAATSATYTLVIGDLAALIAVVVTATNAIGSTAATSASTAAVAAAGSIPVNSVAPAITGTASSGSVLTSSTGTWSNTPTSYAYQWNRAGTPISGATSSTYTLGALDVGSTITVTVSATNGSGTGTATSAATATIGAASGFAPTDLGSLLTHWYDANDAASMTVDGSLRVSQWNDKSGNGYHAVQATDANKPTYVSASTNINSKPVLRTTGGTQVMALSGTNLGSVNAFTFSGISPTSLTSEAFPGGMIFNPQYIGAVWDGSTSITTATPFFRFRGLWFNATRSPAVAPSPAVSAAVFVVGYASGSGGGSNGRILDTVGSATLFGRAAAGDRGWNGDIAEIIVCVGTVSLLNIQKIEGYLCWKWGIQANLDPAHPYAGAAP